MKKLITLLVAMTLVIVALFGVACNESLGNSIVGTYKFKSAYLDVNSGGSVYEIGDNYQGNLFTEDTCILKLLDNNTLEFTYTIGNTTKKLDGVWFRESAYNIGARIEYDIVSAHIDGNNIVLEYGDYYLIILKKV